MTGPGRRDAAWPTFTARRAGSVHGYRVYGHATGHRGVVDAGSGIPVRAATIFITTATDVRGFFIFLGFARLVLV